MTLNVFPVGLSKSERISSNSFERLSFNFTQSCSSSLESHSLKLSTLGRKWVEKGPLTTMKLGSTGMSTSHWCAIVALWFAPGTKEGHGTAQSARTYSFQSRILPTGYKGRTEARGGDRGVCRGEHQQAGGLSQKEKGDRDDAALRRR